MTEDQSRVKIGDVEYQTKIYWAGPDKRQMLEVGGKHGSGYGDLLLVEQFGDMRVKDLPDGLHISLHHPNTPLGLLESFTLLCAPRRTKVSFTLFYSFESWHHPKNLWHYAKELSGKLLADLDEARGASIGQDQGCVWIDVESEIPIKTEVRSYLIDLEMRVQSISQMIDKRKVEPESNSLQLDLKPDEKGLKWWLRYIIVPVLGSAGLIGLIKLFAGQT